MKRICLYEPVNEEKKFTEEIINEWMALNSDSEEYALSRTDKLISSVNYDILFVDTEIDSQVMEEIHEILNRKNDIDICFFVLPQDISSINELNGLEKKYVGSNIGTILKPIQFSKVDQFMNSTVQRAQNIVFDENTDGFDISEFLNH